MNYKKACHHLGIDVDKFNNQNVENNEGSLQYLKRQYRVKALQFHPDKNKSPDASARFQEIHDSYEYLMNYEGFIEPNEDIYDVDPDMDNNKGTYQWILFSFLKNILHNESRNQLFYAILKRVSTMCEKSALETLEKLDKTTLIKTHDILKRYKESFHFTEMFIDKIENLIATKIKNDECIILNPTIDDLFNNHLYKLTVHDFTYIVPLWHHELIYDNSGNDIYVKCYPMLPENVDIDDKNNIYVEIEYNIKDIWGLSQIEIPVGNYRFSISPNLLKLTKTQTISFIEQGISKINTNEVYEISKRSDVYVHITLIL